jgi:O-antigen/teichoic acid export membrane protein
MLLYAAGVGGLLALAALATASFILPLLFGPAYASSAPVLQVLYLAVPALYANMIGGLVARSLDLERTAVAWMALCVLLNVALNAVAIPLWGPLGAAWSSVASQTLLAGLLLRLNLRGLAEGARVPPVETVSTTEVARAV